ncbi:MAG: 16S rRNA (uracil(1498)-N(3))-methyltransferase [Lysobacterales bacterium]
MRLPRVLLPAALRSGDAHELPTGAADHLVRVLRFSVGRRLRVFDGRGAEFDAELIESGKRGARVVLHASVDAAPASPINIALAQALARGEKMDWILQKATELGVATIQPLQTERAEVRLSEERSERRMAHWRGVVVGACEQCGRADVPLLAAPLALTDWLAQVVRIPKPSNELRVFLDPDAKAGIGSESQMPASLVLSVGPEGGFSERELAAFTHAGFAGWRLGPRVLRTETAGMAMLAIAQARWGDMSSA